MASFSPAWGGIADTEQSRMSKVLKDCKIRAIRGSCMNETGPRFTLRCLCFYQGISGKISPHSVML